MIPLFKTHNSIGKSILTADRVFEIAKDNNLDEVFLVEDNLMGFLQFVSLSKKSGIPFRFGVRMDVCNDSDKETERKSSLHKVVVFALNDDGVRILYKLFSHYSVKQEGVTDYETLAEYWDNKSLAMAVPFYDSFLYANLYSFSSAIPDLSFIKNPIFLIEDNGLPFDKETADSIKKYCKKNNYNTLSVKTICYESRGDAEALQTYKLVTGRAQFNKRACLDNPNLEHFGSREFCWESFLDTLLDS